MSPDDETKELDAPWPSGPWTHKIVKIQIVVHAIVIWSQLINSVMRLQKA